MLPTTPTTRPESSPLPPDNFDALQDQEGEQRLVAQRHAAAIATFADGIQNLLIDRGKAQPAREILGQIRQVADMLEADLDALSSTEREMGIS